MLNLTPQEKINLFKSLFRGREDVFAVHWEKADKSASGSVSEKRELLGDPKIKNSL